MTLDETPIDVSKPKKKVPKVSDTWRFGAMLGVMETQLIMLG